MMQQKSVAVFHPNDALGNAYAMILTKARVNSTYFDEAKIVRTILEQLAKKRYDLALMAATFTEKGKEGLEVLAQTDTPIIIQHSRDEYEQEARQLGAVDYFSGVLHVNEIENRVITALGLR